jgi:PhnB protein
MTMAVAQSALVATDNNSPRPDIQPQLAVRHGRAAVDFYKTALGAVELFRHGGTDEHSEVVAQLAIGGSVFWVEDESPPDGNFSPATVGGATARMLLIVDQPDVVVQQAVRAGAALVSPVAEEHGWLLGRIDDPYGHRWEIAKPIAPWPPARTGLVSAVNAQPLRDELVGLSDYAWQRLADRLDGLTDEEYLWGPATGAWTVHPGPGGTWTWDFSWPAPDPPPVTTIAWRLAHIAVNDDRFRPWLGLAPAPGRPHATVPPTAEAALAAVALVKVERHQDLMEVTDADLWEKIGPVGGPYSDSTRVAWALHVLDEVIHHGAEIALLRDLYRARA